MKPVDSIEFPNFLSYHQDEDVCYVLSEWKSDILLSAINPSSFNVVSRTFLKFPVSRFISPVIDDNYIYFFTQMNGIFVIDKFSFDQQEVFDFEIGIPISNVEQNNDCLFVVCGMPIMTGIKTNTDLSSIVIFDKKTGIRRGQSQIFHKSSFSQLNWDGEHLWCVIDKKLTKIDQSGEILRSADLQFSTRNMPLISDDLVVVVSETAIEEFNKKTLEVHKKKIFDKNKTQPFLFGNRIIHGSTIINTEDLSSQTINHVIRHSAFTHKKAYCVDDVGNILLISQGIDEQLYVDKDLNRPMVFENHLLVYSANSSQIFRISK